MPKFNRGMIIQDGKDKFIVAGASGKSYFLRYASGDPSEKFPYNKKICDENMKRVV